MTHGKLLASLLFLAATNAAFGNQNLTKGTTLVGNCSQDGHREKFTEFVLIQDPKGGLETKSAMVPGARVTVEYETASNNGKFFHARFSLYSFSGDLAVLEGRKVFEWLDREQVLQATLQTKAGVKIHCVADVRSN